MRNRFTRNWGLKIASILFAAALWVVVTNVNDPVVSMKVSDVPVIIKNANLITDSGQIYEVLDDTDVIDTVTITAARSVIDSLDASNIIAIADMNDLTNLDTIGIKLSTNKYNEKLESIKGNIDCVRLNIEDKKTKSLPIRTSTTGEVKSGYIVGDVIAEQNLVKVSGPESVISRISKAQAEVDVSGFTNNIGTDSEIKFYDEDGKEVKSPSIEKSITKVRVNVAILETKTVPIEFATSGEPASGYVTSGEISSTRNMVLIAGRSSVIQNISAVEIPEEAIDITDADSDVTVLIDLKKYLPDGVILAEQDFKGRINVTIAIESIAEKEMTISANRIEVRGVPDGFTWEFQEETEYIIRLTGRNADLLVTQETDLKPYVDVQKWMRENEVEELSKGTIEVPMEVSLSNRDISMKEEVMVELQIKEAEE